MDQNQNRTLEDLPELYRPLTKRAFEKTGTARNAIKAKCLECCGYVRADVAACIATRCPLHAYRPYQAKR